MDISRVVASRVSLRQRSLLVGLLVVAMGALTGRALSGSSRVPAMPRLTTTPSARAAELHREVARMLELRRLAESERANDASLLPSREVMPSAPLVPGF